MVPQLPMPRRSRWASNGWPRDRYCSWCARRAA